MKNLAFGVLVVFATVSGSTQARVISLDVVISVACQIIETDHGELTHRIPECRQRFKEVMRTNGNVRHSGNSLLMLLSRACSWGHLRAHNQYACYLRSMQSRWLFDSTQRSVLMSYFQLADRPSGDLFPQYSKVCNRLSDGGLKKCLEKAFAGLAHIDQLGLLKTKFPSVRL